MEKRKGKQSDGGQAGGKRRRLLTPDDVIEILALDGDGCSRKTAHERLRNRCRSRQIPFVKLGRLVRFRPEDIDRLIEEHTVEAIDS